MLLQTPIYYHLHMNILNKLLNAASRHIIVYSFYFNVLRVYLYNNYYPPVENDAVIFMLHVLYLPQVLCDLDRKLFCLFSKCLFNDTLNIFQSNVMPVLVFKKKNSSGLLKKIYDSKYIYI